MPKVTLAGHPLHPMLIAVPAALIPFQFHPRLHVPVDRQKILRQRCLLRNGVATLGGLAAGASDYFTNWPISVFPDLKL